MLCLQKVGKWKLSFFVVLRIPPWLRGEAHVQRGQAHGRAHSQLTGAWKRDVSHDVRKEHLGSSADDGRGGPLTTR